MLECLQTDRHTCADDLSLYSYIDRFHQQPHRFLHVDMNHLRNIYAMLWGYYREILRPGSWRKNVWNVYSTLCLICFIWGDWIGSCNEYHSWECQSLLLMWAPPGCTCFSRSPVDRLFRTESYSYRHQTGFLDNLKWDTWNQTEIKNTALKSNIQTSLVNEQGKAWIVH